MMATNITETVGEKFGLLAIKLRQSKLNYFPFNSETWKKNDGY